jgi:hypothetical protein
MRRDRKSNSTIIDVKPSPAKDLIFSSMGSYNCCRSGTFSQRSCLPIGALINNSSRSWKSVYTITQSSLQRSHLPGLRGVMYGIDGLLLPCKY